MNKNTRKIYKLFIVTIFLIIICLNSINAFATDVLSVDAKASLIVETNSGKIIHENNSNAQIYPASVTKILTAILVLENCELNDVATVSESAISDVPEGYVISPLFVGEQMKVQDLLYALMLKSANDAAYVLAEHVGGTVEEFSNMMNKKAKELGCINTHFVNPNGIHNDNHYTTAFDMYLISKYAMQNKTFAKIVSTYQYTLPATNKYTNDDRIMKNTNYFINPKSKYYNENVNGIKTGTTLKAGNCLITDVTKDDFNIITVVLGAETEETRFSETNKMINYMFDNYTHTQLHKKGDVIKNVEVQKATKETRNLNIIIAEDIRVMNNIKTNLDEIEPEIILNENIIAPISKNQELGLIKYTVDGIEYNTKLLAENDVELKTYYVEILITGCVILIIVMLKLAAKKKKANKQ